MLEITTFTLRADADVDAFIEADKVVQSDVAYQQRGISRRTTARGDGRRWAVVTLWGDQASADAAAPRMAAHPATAAFDAFIDASTRTTERFELLPG